MAALVTVNSFDLTPYIVAKTYAVNRQDVFDEWTDGNGIVHRNITRTRIEGEFQAKFWKHSAYATFMSNMAGVKTDGYYPMTVYLNNAETTSSANLYVEYAPAMTYKYTTPEYEVINFKVRER